MSGGFTEVTSESWLGRLGNAIKGVVFGLVLFLVSFPLLWWNEGRAVDRAKVLADGKKAAVSVQADTVNPANDGKLVHMTGQATTDKPQVDDLFSVSVAAIRLDRVAEMYQWVEKESKTTEKKLGGGEETRTTYTYDKQWVDHLVDSDKFNDPSYRGKNPADMPVKGERFVAHYPEVSLGAFKLSDDLINGMSWPTPYKPQAKPADAAPAGDAPPAAAPGASSFTTPSAMTVKDGVYYSGNSSSPQIGDVKVRFEAVLPQVVSILATQKGDTFQSTVLNGKTLEQNIVQGNKSAAEMFQQLEAANAMLTWILRLVGFLMMAIGLYMIASPLVIVADVVPFIGDLIGAGASLFAGLIALSLSFLTIALAWVAYRPLIGIPLLIVAIGSFVGLYAMRKRKPAVPAAPPAA